MRICNDRALRFPITTHVFKATVLFGSMKPSKGMTNAAPSAIWRLIADYSGVSYEAAYDKSVTEIERQNKEEKGKYAERRGFSSNVRPNGSLIWIHAASVGEALSSIPLIEELKKLSPKIKIIITTGTKTSKEVIIKKNIDGVIHQYAPWDIESFCLNFLNFWQPDMAIFLESEIWPNLLNETYNKSIPICLINARITDRTFKNWLKFPKTIEYLLCLLYTSPSPRDS